MKYFVSAKLEVISFAVQDVITTSNYKVDDNGGIDGEVDFIDDLLSI